MIIKFMPNHMPNIKLIGCVHKRSFLYIVLIHLFKYLYYTQTITNYGVKICLNFIFELQCSAYKRAQFRSAHR